MKAKYLPTLILALAFLNNAVSQDQYLMVIDVQNKFYEGSKVEQQANEMVGSINTIIKSFDPENVIYVKATAKMLTVSYKGIKAEPFFPAPEIDHGLNIVNNQIFTKTEGSAFSLVELNNLLQKRGVKKIILVGLLAEKCVYKTAIDGIDKGYDIFIAKEAVLSKSESKKAKVFRKMTQKGVKIISTKELQ